MRIRLNLSEGPEELRREGTGLAGEGERYLVAWGDPGKLQAPPTTSQSVPMWGDQGRGHTHRPRVNARPVSNIIQARRPRSSRTSPGPAWDPGSQAHTPLGPGCPWSSGRDRTCSAQTGSLRSLGVQRCAQPGPPPPQRLESTASGLLSTQRRRDRETSQPWSFAQGAGTSHVVLGINLQLHTWQVCTLPCEPPFGDREVRRAEASGARRCSFKQDFLTDWTAGTRALL